MITSTAEEDGYNLESFGVMLVFINLFIMLALLGGIIIEVYTVLRENGESLKVNSGGFNERTRRTGPSLLCGTGASATTTPTTATTTTSHAPPSPHAPTPRPRSLKMYIAETYSFAKEKGAMIRVESSKVRAIRNPMFSGASVRFSGWPSNPSKPAGSPEVSTPRKTASANVDVEDIYGRDGSDVDGIELQGRSSFRHSRSDGP